MTKKDHCNKNDGCVESHDSAALHDCESYPSRPVTTPGGKKGAVYAKVPVAVAERTVSTSLSAKVKFPFPVLEIKDIKKRVKIEQCSLMLPPVKPGEDPFEPTYGRLFLKGSIRKNVQYASPIMEKCGNYSKCISSTIRSHTFEIPWECSVALSPKDFNSPPQRPVMNVRGEFDYHVTKDLGHGHPEKDHLLTSDLSQFHQQSTQFYNEFPFCELISSKITEWDEAIDRKPLHGHYSSDEGYFHTIIEKVFLEVTIKVLQKQQAHICVNDNNDDCRDYDY